MEQPNNTPWSSKQLSAWCAALQAGQVVAAPAEGVYGYCCDPFNPQALQSLLTLKQRSDAKGFIVLAASAEQAKSLCASPLPPQAEQAMAQFWPDAVTLVLPAAAHLPPLLTGGRPTIAVRVPKSPYMQSYLQAWDGVLVSTSLNISGHAPATEAAAIPPGVPALVLEQPLGGTPSRILDTLTGTWLR